MTDELVKKLHPHEKKLLLALKKLSEAGVEEISKEAGIPEAQVHKAGNWARLKNLVEHREEKVQETFLTEEGQRYAKEGIPEKLLITLVSEGRDNTEHLKKEIPELEIALAWSKRKGWIEIQGKRITLTELGKNALEAETPLEKSLRGRMIKEALEEMKKRKLVRIKETKKKKFFLTPRGERILPMIKRLPKREIGQLKPEHLKSGEWSKSSLRPYDVSTPAPTVYPAKIHPYIRIINETRNKMLSLGFKEVTGPWAELEFWNSDALFMPQDHPARGIHDVFKLRNPSKGEVRHKYALQRVGKTHKNGWITGSSGWGSWDPEQTLNLVMRSQTTSLSARTLASGVEPPGKFFSLSRVFRPDVIDATHSFEFHQLEGIVVAENMNLRHLLGYLEIFGREVAGAEDIRFRPSYFPFTEPSVELDGYVNGKWIELAGSGIFRPEVTRPLGCDVPVLAWGAGFARLAMIKLGISDIRELYSHDLDWLRRRVV